MSEPLHVPVGRRALRLRIDRALPPEKKLCAVHPASRQAAAVGHYFVLDTTGHSVEQAHVELEAFGRSLGVLRAYEYLDESD